MNYIDEFLRDCKLRGLTKKSINNYSEFIRRFYEYFSGSGADPPDKLLNYENFKKYIEYLYDKNLSKASINTYITHLKVYIHWLEVEGYLNNIFSHRIKKIRQPKKNVYIYSDEEIRKIFNVVEAYPLWVQVRNLLLISLMLDSGLRRHELTEIKIVDIDYNNNILLVHGKGNKDRFVPLGKLTCNLLNQYIDVVPFQSDFLFLTIKGVRLTDNAVKQFIHKLSTKLSFELSCHKLRHNFATNYCLDEYEKNGFVDIYKLMVLLGHEDIKTTRRYLHLANQLIAANHHSSHLDKIFVTGS